MEQLEDLSERRTIVIFNEEWHKGVIGIVASRLTEIYYRPAVVLTRTNDLATGSARSVSGFDVYKAIEEIRKLDPSHIFTKERGFAPGDPRRCRGHRFGPREGFHQMEKEYTILGYVAEALENPKEVEVEAKKPIEVDEFKKIMNECLENKE